MQSVKKEKIIIILSVIVVISLFLKLYLVDFSTPFTSDNLGYLLRAFGHLNGNFDQTIDKSLGWSLFIYPFYNIIDSENILDYSNLIRILSISISLLSVIVFFFIARKFFDVKYSLVATCMFGFEPHLNYYSVNGLSESLYILIILGSFFYAIQNRNRFIIPSLILAGSAWWLRINGLGVLILMTIIILISQKRNSKQIGLIIIGIFFAILVISPILIQRQIQYDDPMYSDFNNRIFIENYDIFVSRNISTDNSLTQYIETHGIAKFFEKFILLSSFNTLSILISLSFPYLIFLLPFGILFSFRAFDQNKKIVWANWIFILGNIFLLFLILSNVPERRYLILIIPSLIIISTIPIQRLIEYGLSTFSFSNKEKTISLLIIISIILILSIMFTIFQYEKPNYLLENEKMEIAQYIVTNLNGTVLDNNGFSFEYIPLVQVTKPHGDFKSIYDFRDRKSLINPDFKTIDIYANSVEELLISGKEFNLKYIIVDANSGDFHKYTNEIYSNENLYPYLIKIYDSSNNGMKFVKTKIFEIDYEKFILND